VGKPAENVNFALDESLWFGEGDDAEAESRAAASLAAVGTRIVGAKPFPVAARRLDELTRNPNTRIEQVVTVLESDPALSARLLRLVNSAGYGLKVRCTSARHAAVLVGTRRLNQVATTAAILDLFDGNNTLGVELLEHAAVVGSLCRYLGVHLGLPHDELFTCGFLHDIGKLMLLDAERERYAELLAEFGSAPDQMHLAERRLFGFDHAVLGAHVLAAWNIPEPVPRVIAWHHAPARAMQDTVIAAMVQTLRLADLLAYVLPMPDTRLAIEITAGSDSARYLEISDVQLAAMWEDLLGLRERSRARSHGEPELDVMVPKLEVPESLVPRSSRPSKLSRAPSSMRASRPLQEVPAHFPCHVCGKPSYAHVCAACGGQVCPEHQAGAEEWCTACSREFVQFKKTERLTTAVRAGVGLLVGTTLSVAVVSAVRVPGSSVQSWVLAPLLVLALWAVAVPVAYRLWRKLTFLNRRRGTAGSSAVRQQMTVSDSMTPREALPTLGPMSAEKLRVAAGASSPELSLRPDEGSDPALSVAPSSVGPTSSVTYRSISPASLPPPSSQRPVSYSMAPGAPSVPSSDERAPSVSASEWPRSQKLEPALSLAATSLLPEHLQSLSPKISLLPEDSQPEVSLRPSEFQTVPPTVMPVSTPPTPSAEPVRVVEASLPAAPRLSVAAPASVSMTPPVTPAPSLTPLAASLPPVAQTGQVSFAPAALGAPPASLPPPASISAPPAPVSVTPQVQAAPVSGIASVRPSIAAAVPSVAPPAAQPEAPPVPPPAVSMHPPKGRRVRKPRRRSKKAEQAAAAQAALEAASAAEAVATANPKLAAPHAESAPSAEPAAKSADSVEAPVTQKAPEEGDESGPSSQSGAHLVLRKEPEPQVNSRVKASVTVGCAARSLQACVSTGGPVSSYGEAPMAVPGSRESA